MGADAQCAVSIKERKAVPDSVYRTAFRFASKRQSVQAYSPKIEVKGAEVGMPTLLFNINISAFAENTDFIFLAVVFLVMHLPIFICL